MTGTADLGIVGMAVMGSNLARNFAHKGYTVAVFNRTYAKTQELIADHGHEGAFVPNEKLADFVASIRRPRSIILMVKAGAATDATINELVPLLEPGDIIMDGGNSYFQDTRRRETELREKGIHFVGTGISGGEEGALNGPSIMPGGSQESYKTLGPMLEKISAHVGTEPCCAWLGTDGAGHFVKMIHNGIEYSDMQVIGEAYELLRGLGLTNAECAEVFARWNEGELNSYLIEITAIVLAQTDPVTGKDLIDIIKDRAGMKGTGTWTVATALELGVPVSGIAEAVFARAESSHDALRQVSQKALHGPDRKIDADILKLMESGATGQQSAVPLSTREDLIEDIRRALWCAKVVSYSQGFDLIRTGGAEYGWNIDVATCAKIWRAGCIIRAKLLENIRAAYAADPALVSLMAAPGVAEQLNQHEGSWRRVVAIAALAGVSAPVFSSTLGYFDAARAPRVNAALTQGLRDYFGAHTYERVDAPGHFHLEWSGDRTQTKTSDN
jgi:6-phosphogluconate dehydrogenase